MRVLHIAPQRPPPQLALPAAEGLKETGTSEQGGTAFTFSLTVRIARTIGGILSPRATGRREGHKDLKVLFDRVKAVLDPGAHEQNRAR